MSDDNVIPLTSRSQGDAEPPSASSTADDESVPDRLRRLKRTLEDRLLEIHHGPGDNVTVNEKQLWLRSEMQALSLELLTATTAALASLAELWNIVIEGNDHTIKGFQSVMGLTTFVNDESERLDHTISRLDRVEDQIRNLGGQLSDMRGE